MSPPQRTLSLNKSIVRRPLIFRLVSSPGYVHAMFLQIPSYLLHLFLSVSLPLFLAFFFVFSPLRLWYCEGFSFFLLSLATERPTCRHSFWVIHLADRFLNSPKYSTQPFPTIHALSSLASLLSPTVYKTCVQHSPFQHDNILVFFSSGSPTPFPSL